MMRKEAWAQNAVIAQDDGFSVRFRPRCPKCGYVDTMLMSTSISSGRSIKVTSCLKCRESIQIVIGRG